jgi:ribA/ribD-fused uncharacterized protein
MKTYNNYPIVNNIILFSKGEFSQWYGAFPGQSSNFDFATPERIHNFNCAEQAMMCYKADFFRDFDTAQKILNEKHPKRQKDLGRTVKNFDPFKWDEIKFDLITNINIAKFSQNEHLKKILLESDPYILCEAAPWDKIWGNGLAADDPKAGDIATWEGQNLLGKALMKVRSIL